MATRIYADTSVVGGCEDEEFAEHSVRLIDGFVRGELILVLSSLTVQELADAPLTVRSRLAAVPEAHIETLQLDAEARELAESYMAAGVLTAKMRADAQHIAIATIGRVDVLVSWNFKHIVNLQRIHGYNSVKLAIYFTQVTPRCCGPVGGLPRLFRGQAADQPQRPKRRRHCCSGALQAVFGCNAVAWSPKTTARRWAPRVCRKPGPQQVGAT